MENRYLLFLVNKATKRPQRPSRFLGFHDMVSEETCLDFDLTVEEFDLWFDTRTRRTASVPAPKPDHRNPMMEIPYFENLDQLLGYAPSPYEVPDAATLDDDESDALSRFEAGEIDLHEAIEALRERRDVEE